MKILISSILLLSIGVSHANIDNVNKEQTGANKEAKDSQKKVDRLSDETQRLLESYTSTLTKIENMKIYNAQLRKYIKSQEEEEVSIQSQMKQVAETNQGITPLMLKMLESLQQFVQLDTPFLSSERSKRIAELNTLIDRADITTSEKYRRILEAYQVENEYGRTIEVYRDILVKDGKEMTVDYLRIGRVSFLYQTLDGKEQAFWNNETKQWVELPSSYAKEIATGIKIARQQSAPDLIKIPVIGPTRL